MMDVAHLDDDVIGVEIALAVRQAQVGDIGRIGREDARHLGERAGLVEDDDAQSRIAPLAVLLPAQVDPVRVDAVGQARARSEEHTSELQSLMRISYAVFCLKKKKPIKTTHYVFDHI